MNRDELKTITLRPKTLLDLLTKAHPNLWKMLEKGREDLLAKGQRWSNYCFVPTGGLSATPHTRHKLNRADDFLITVTMGTWRQTKGVYIFDQTLIEELWKTPIIGNLPIEVLHRIPEWCVYVATPNQWFGTDRLHGFFARLDLFTEPEGEETEELILMLDLETSELRHMIKVIPIQLKGTIEEGLTKSKQIFLNAPDGSLLTDQLFSLNLEQTIPLINLLLYLCAENAEIRDSQGTSKLPKNPKAQRVKSGSRIFAASDISTWEIGYRIGPSLRKARQQTQTDPTNEGTPLEHSSPHPHIRRAHWHSFWVGSHKQQNRELVLRWLPPIPVNIDKGDIVVTVREP